jgi:hypothetical protein
MRRRVLCQFLGGALLAPLACTLGGVEQRSGGIDYFARPDPRDPWSTPIRKWQVRVAQERALRDAERAGAGGSADGAARAGTGRELDGVLPTLADGGAPQRAGLPADGDPDLTTRYAMFRSELRRGLARRVADWTQTEGRSFFIPERGADYWPTLGEMLATNGDDCDGLELLGFYLLRDLGFSDDEVFRCVVVRTADRQHHMVTLWFESPGDPWVIDPTGAMTLGMPRLSEVPDWTPLKVFTETREFTVRHLS